MAGRIGRAAVGGLAVPAPPGNRPEPEELRRCAPFLDRELGLLRPKVVLALGAIGWGAALGALERRGHPLPRPRPKFAMKSSAV